MKHTHDVKYFQIGCFVFLMLLVLSACGAKTPAPAVSAPSVSEPAVSEPAQGTAADQKTVTVSTIEELAEAMENDTCVILKEGVYNFSELDYAKVETSMLKKTEYPYDTKYVISGASGLSLIAEEGADVEVVTEDYMAVVLDFLQCSNITLKGLTVGHYAEPGACDGDVIGISESSDVRIEDCRLYGCGTYGLDIDCAENISVTGTEIYECSNGIFQLYDVKEVSFDDCRFYNNFGWNLFTMTDCRETVIRNTEIYENHATAPDVYTPIETDGECDVLFQDCVFRDNDFEPDVEWLMANTQIVFENCEMPETDIQAVFTGYARNVPIESDDFLRLEISDASVIGPDDSPTGETVVTRVSDDYFSYLARKDETRFFLQEYDSYREKVVSIWVSWEEFLSQLEARPDGELLVTYEIEAVTIYGCPVIESISAVYLPSDEIPTADPAMTMEDLVGRWSLTEFEVEGYMEKVSEDGLEHSFTFVLNDDGSISASHIDEHEYGGVTEITDAPVRQVETDRDYLLFQQYGIPWYGELDMTGQPVSEEYVVWESYNVGLIDENTLLVHYVAETTIEPYMVGVSYQYSRVTG